MGADRICLQASVNFVIFLMELHLFELDRNVWLHEVHFEFPYSSVFCYCW